MRRKGTLERMDKRERGMSGMGRGKKTGRYRRMAGSKAGLITLKKSSKRVMKRK